MTRLTLTTLVLTIAQARSLNCNDFIGTCPAGTRRRDHNDMYECTKDACDTTDCCRTNCFIEMANRGGLTCSPNMNARPENDWHDPFSGDSVSDWSSRSDQEIVDSCCSKTCFSTIKARSLVCDIGEPRSQTDFHMSADVGVWDSVTDTELLQECCRVNCHYELGHRSLQCPAGYIPRSKDDWHLPFGNNWNAHNDTEVVEECCRMGCGAAKPAVQCPVGEILRTDVTCSDGECEQDKCCDHPLVQKCQTDAAQECSKCAKFSPCLSSIDPRCINQEALDCLYCEEEHSLTECSACAPGFDENCLQTYEYNGPGCEDQNFQHGVPLRHDGECYLLAPFGSYGYSTRPLFGGGYASAHDCNPDCTSCEEESTYTEQEYQDYISGIGSCAEDKDDMDSSRTLGSLSAPGLKIACPDGRPCGPASCIPGVDPMCVVFVVFGLSSRCVGANISTYASVGDYHAYGIADNTCRMDGSGRSFYKLRVNHAGDGGTGLIGCVDDRCVDGCTPVAMDREVCSSPDWANGLQLVATLVEERGVYVKDGNVADDDENGVDENDSVDDAGKPESSSGVSAYVSMHACALALVALRCSL